MNKNGRLANPKWSQEEQRGKTAAKTTGDGSKVEQNGGRVNPKRKPRQKLIANEMNETYTAGRDKN